MRNDFDFTVALEDEFYSVVDKKDFKENDAESIYKYLNNRTKIISFSDYLKRYILKKMNINADIGQFDIRFYQNYIINSFNNNSAPKSFRETSTKTSAITKNWLTQTSVKRDVIFLLGFGLDMTVDEVSYFLVNVQKEHDFNFKNPFEIICWYCYSRKLKYPEFLRLMDLYSNNSEQKDEYDFDSTIAIRDIFYGIKNENDLMHSLQNLKIENGGKSFSTTSKLYFDNLYNKIRKIIADQYNEDEIIAAENKAKDYMQKMSNSDKISIEEKVFRAEIIKKSARSYMFSDITEADVEKVLCCGTPFDEKGNLLKYSYSTLSDQFENKRMSRKHLRDIILGKTEIERFDLITMNFYIYAISEETNNNKRYIDFVNDTNSILKDCYMGEMYVANPYESFLMMCMLTDYPMGTYCDVIELSFDNNLHNGSELNLS